MKRRIDEITDKLLRYSQFDSVPKEPGQIWDIKDANYSFLIIKNLDINVVWGIILDNKYAWEDCQEVIKIDTWRGLKVVVPFTEGPILINRLSGYVEKITDKELQNVIKDIQNVKDKELNIVYHKYIDDILGEIDFLREEVETHLNLTEEELKNIIDNFINDYLSKKSSKRKIIPFTFNTKDPYYYFSFAAADDTIKNKKKTIWNEIRKKHAVAKDIVKNDLYYVRLVEINNQYYLVIDINTRKIEFVNIENIKILTGDKIYQIDEKWKVVDYDLKPIGLNKFKGDKIIFKITINGDIYSKNINL